MNKLRYLSYKSSKHLNYLLESLVNNQCFFGMLKTLVSTEDGGRFKNRSEYKFNPLCPVFFLLNEHCKPLAQG